jgi:hypothetical protein
MSMTRCSLGASEIVCSTNFGIYGGKTEENERGAEFEFRVCIAHVVCCVDTESRQ